MRFRILFLLFGLGIFTLTTLPLHAAEGFHAECRKATGDYVVLVHGLDWFRDTLQPTADFLHARGYETVNVRYPSRKIASTGDAADWVRKVVATHCRDPRKRIHLVAHSMGALVVRRYLEAGKPDRLGRVVFMAAPNQGTPLAEALKWKTLAKMISPAVAGSCCPVRTDSPKPAPADYAPGILMGNRPGWFPYLSPFIKGPDDGVVAVESGRLDGMADFRVLTTSHTRMPKNAAAQREVLAFLQAGRFAPK